MWFGRRQAKRLTASWLVLGAAAVGMGATQPAAADQTSDKQAEAVQIAAKLQTQLDARMMDLNSQYERANFGFTRRSRRSLTPSGWRTRPSRSF